MLSLFSNLFFNLDGCIHDMIEVAHVILMFNTFHSPSQLLRDLFLTKMLDFGLGGFAAI